MQFEIWGGSELPKILLIHPMYMDPSCYAGLSGKLDGYCTILPTLDGHGTDGCVFHSIAEEADRILAYLRQNGIGELAVVSGFSLGGMVAFELFRRRAVKIHRLFLDGAPFIRLPAPVGKGMEALFLRFTHRIQRLPEKPGALERDFPHHAEKIREVCGRMTDESIRNLAKACYGYRLPAALPTARDESIVFLYGTAETARKAMPHLRRYANAHFVTAPGMHHGQMLAERPTEYTALLLGQVGNKAAPTAGCGGIGKIV